MGPSTCGTLYGPRAAELRCPVEEQTLISFGRGLGDSAAMCHDRVQRILLDQHDAGGVFATADGREIDFERAQRSGEMFVYDTGGGRIYLSKDVRLLEADEAFGQCPRRTWNRMFAKLGKPTNRRVSTENLSRYFWLNLARIIHQRRE